MKKTTVFITPGPIQVNPKIFGSARIGAHVDLNKVFPLLSHVSGSSMARVKTAWISSKKKIPSIRPPHPVFLFILDPVTHNSPGPSRLVVRQGSRKKENIFGVLNKKILRLS